MTYQEYMDTGKWKLTSRMCIERDGGRCRQCGSAEHLQAHHISYAHWNAKNMRLELDDLVTLCRKCHLEYHRFAANDPVFKQHQFPF